MDLIKIGKYIAEKRKALGLTQKQLAEKLNMSDKSVSKWERGICLPDVSIYMELCSILRISINEFLAGEDIGTENVIEKSDSNLIVSSIAASDWDFTKDEFKTLTIYVSEYQSGTLISKSKVADLDHDGIDSPSRGVIAVVPDFESFKVKLIVADDYAKYSTDFPILENIENREYYVRSASQIKGEIPIQIHSASTIEGKTAILSDSEQGLMALIYGKDGLSGIPITEMEKGIVGVENDYVYYLSFQFFGG